MRSGDYGVARERMVREQVWENGIRDRRIVEAMLKIPRHLFLDEDAGAEAYSNHAFPIGYSQTMSQPSMVAYLAQELDLCGDESVLEIGTGSGYQAAVLSMLTARVFSVERIGGLAQKAQRIFTMLSMSSVEVKIGDGALGWPEKAPFDRILLTAAAIDIPHTLVSQLRHRGFLLGPVIRSSGEQEIVKLVRLGDRLHLERLRDCSFVPLVRGAVDIPPRTEARPEPR